MKKILFSVMIVMFVCFTFAGCGSASDNSYTAEIQFFAPTQEEVFAHRDSLDTDKYEVIEMIEQKGGKFFIKRPEGWVLKYKEIDSNKKETNSTEQHSCVWDVKEVGDKVAVFCKECGKMAE